MVWVDHVLEEPIVELEQTDDPIDNVVILDKGDFCQFCNLIAVICTNSFQDAYDHGSGSGLTFMKLFSEENRLRDCHHKWQRKFSFSVGVVEFLEQCLIDWQYTVDKIVVV